VKNLPSVKFFLSYTLQYVVKLYFICFIERRLHCRPVTFAFLCSQLILISCKEECELRRWD